MDDWQNLIFVKLSFFLNLTLTELRLSLKKIPNKRKTGFE
ncbi:hypothetical protein BROOK1789C_465 [Bathymodiolus brooksi thiotrophic gill symbiont]|nr:hypothetical protein BROOK1789C_465 [Bathymodiolus brooksi thiotrophic gill symbiont]CAC9597251.1 hypothetical protein [uncultured Gammaproteobacteria bacterium]CAC9971783.1 hypothetical protein [uncultured Gammaproteobacteria bacterium]